MVSIGVTPRTQSGLLLVVSQKLFVELDRTTHVIYLGFALWSWTPSLAKVSTTELGMLTSMALNGRP